MIGASLTVRHINGADFPISPAETQPRIHGHDSEASLNEAHGVDGFACDHNFAGSNSTRCLMGTMLALVLAGDVFEISLALCVATFFVTCAGK